MKKKFFIMAMLSGIGFLVSLLNQILISNYFGTSVDIDAYWLTFTIVQLLTFYIGPAKEALIPEYHNLLSTDPEKGHRYFSQTINFVMLVVAASGLAMICFPGPIAHLVASSRYAAVQEKLPTFILLMTPMVFLFTISETLNAVLAAYDKVLYQNVGRIINVSIISFCLLGLHSTIKIYALLSGVMLGYSGLIALQFAVLTQAGFRYHILSRPRIDTGYFRLVRALIISYAASQLHVVLEKNSLTMFGEGTISAYQYAFTLSQVPQMVFIGSLSLVVWPQILEAVNQNTGSAVWQSMQEAIKLLVIVLGFVTIVCFIFADNIVYILYYRGAFDHRSLLLTGTCFKILLIALVPAGISAIIARVLISNRYGRELTLIGLSNATVGILCLMVGRIAHSFQVVIANYTLAAFASVAVSLFLLNTKMNSDRHLFFNVRNTIWFSKLAILVLALFLIYPRFWLPESNKTMLTLAIGLHTVFLSAVYLFALKALKLIHVGFKDHSIKPVLTVR